MDIKKVIKCNLSLIFFFLDILKTFWPVFIWVSPRICKKTAFTKRSQFDKFLCWARTLALSANAGTCVITYDPWWLNFKTSYLFFFNIFISDKKWHLPLEKSFTDNLMNNLDHCGSSENNTLCNWQIDLKIWSWFKVNKSVSF